MSPQIAILGWGSLLWDGGAEFDRWHGEWRYDGPTLKLEFSRVSGTRLGALSLVIDPQHGEPNTVAWCLSKRNDPQDAIADLRCREGTPMRNIKNLVLDNKPLLEDETSKQLAAWANEQKLDIVVWTALSSNFDDQVQKPFSVQEAITYLKQLPAAGKAKAAEYIWCAPKFIRTPLRSAIEQESWFPAPEDS
jgi:hypothetical protein